MNRFAFTILFITALGFCACGNDADDDDNRSSVDRNVHQMLNASATLMSQFCECHADDMGLTSAGCQAEMGSGFGVSPCAMTVMRQDAYASANALSCVAASYAEAENCLLICDWDATAECLDRMNTQIDQCMSLYTNAQFAALQQCNGTSSSPEDNRFDIAVDAYDDAVAVQLDVACTCAYGTPEDRDTCFAANYTSVTEEACFMNTIRLDPAGSAAFLSCATDAVAWSTDCMSTCPADTEQCSADFAECVELLSPTVLAELQGC